MKVLLVHDDYQHAGGERTAVLAQLALLRKHRCGVVEYTRSNAEIGGYSAWEKALFFPRTLYSPRTARELRALVRAERPDVAHVHNVFPLISPAAYRVLSDLGVPIVQTMHNFRFMCPNALFYTQGAVCE